MMNQGYRGWTLTDHGPHAHPVTGRHRANRHGVSMGHPTREGLLRMIDAKVDEEERLRDLRRQEDK
jgi:hypothetical protein